MTLDRDLRVFYAFRLLATSYLYVPIFMVFQADRGLSYFERLALGGIYAGVVVLAELPTGVFADRIGRRRSMQLGALAMVGSCALAVCAHGFTTFAVAEALAALSIALCSGADSAYLYDLLASHGRTADYSRRESTASAWHLVGSALGFAAGGLLASIDLALPYVITGAVAAAAAVVACAMRDDRPARTGRANAGVRVWWRHTVDAVTEVGVNGRLAWLVGYSAVMFLLLRATAYVYQPYLAECGLSTGAIGFVFAGGYLISALAANATHRLRARFGDEALLWGVLGALAVGFVGLAGARHGAWMLVLLLIQAVANGIYSPLIKPLLNREVADSRRRAAVLSVESMIRRAAMGLFAPLAGLYGQGDGMVLCGAVALGGFAVLAVGRWGVPTVIAIDSVRRPDQTARPDGDASRSH